MILTKNKTQIISKLSTLVGMFTLFTIKNNVVFATGIGTQEVQTATDNIKRVITSIAMPLGGVLIFGGGVVLGASLIIAGIIINVATNNTGSLLGS